MQIAKEQGGSIQTTDLKRLMVQKFKPRGNDAAVNANHQKNFEQVVGNLISNGPKMKSSMFNLGYADYIDDGFSLTKAGLAFLRNIPA